MAQMIHANLYYSGARVRRVFSMASRDAEDIARILDIS